ncbi:RimK family alpha-L-glutamate ligase [Bhargavaea ullalensis]|uniref:Ribosomal protein S6--L-glutamate ligase n=1 Tax=Bhargavaea ullalensis TaxID=1265685 RepID=A0ABV2G8N7_9BACL
MNGVVYYRPEDAKTNAGFIRMLKEAADRAGHGLELVTERGKIPDSADFVLFRDRDPELAHELEAAGHRLFNRAQVNRVANDKYATYELALLLGLPTVPTRRVAHPDEIRSYPSVLKTIDGHGGTEVVRCLDKMDAGWFFSRHAGRRIIGQPFIESGAADVRLFMIGEEAVGAVKRTGSNGFKSNYTLGGRADPFSPTAGMEEAAAKIARALKSDYIGVDFLLLPDGGFLLNEIEDPVGSRSLYDTSEVNIADRIMQRIAEQMK